MKSSSSSNSKDVLKDLERLARKLRHRVVIRDREGGKWISQIYQNTFTGTDAHEKMSKLLKGKKLISVLESMMSEGYFSRVNGSRRFRAKPDALYRFKWDDPTKSASLAETRGDLEWEFPKHVKANSFILGTALGDWIENALAKGSAKDIQRAIVTVRQKVLDAGRFNGNFTNTDERFRGCKWKTVKTDEKSNIIVQQLEGPAVDGADYSTVRVTGFLQQPVDVTVKTLLDPKIRESHGEMMRKECKYVDVLEKVRTRIRRSSKARRHGSDSSSEILDDEEDSTLDSIPTLKGLSEVGGRFFSNVELQNLALKTTNSLNMGESSEEEDTEAKENTDAKPSLNRLASEDTMYYSASSGEDEDESKEKPPPFRLDSSSSSSSSTSTTKKKSKIHRSKTWQESSRREDVKHGYILGDLSRSLLKKASAYTDDLQHLMEKPTCVFDRFFSTKTEPITDPRPSDSTQSSHTTTSSSDNSTNNTRTTSSFISPSPPQNLKKNTVKELPFPPKIVIKKVTPEVADTTTTTTTATSTKVTEENEDESCDKEDEKEVVAALAAMSNMCVLYRTHQKVSSFVKMIMGNYDSVLLNDSFSTSDNLYVLWGTSVLHDRTPQRLKFNRLEILFHCQVVEPVAGYHGMSRLTVTYQLRNQSLGVLEYINYKRSMSNLTLRPAVRKGVAKFRELQDFLKRPAVEAHMERLKGGSPTTLPPEVHERQKERREKLNENTKRIRTMSSARSPLKTAGVQLADFEILSVCGRGGFGKVLQVRRAYSQSEDVRDRERLYAMKVISKQKMMKKNQIGHVIVERQILSALSNRGKIIQDDKKKEVEPFPFIVRLYFAFQTRTHLFLVMEFVPGGDLLSRLVKHGRLTLRLTTIYAAEIFLALDYLHKLGIMYRDMKPENLLITSDGHLKLADFGVSYIDRKGYAGSMSPPHRAMSPSAKKKSHHHREDNGPCSFVGTEIYMAPELISQAIRARRKKKKTARASKPYDGEAVDWWGFGVLFYNMLTARHPFVTGKGKSGNTRLETLQNILNDSFVPIHLHDVGKASPGAEKLLSGLFERDPKRRLTSSQIRDHEFFKKIDWDDVLTMKKPLPREANVDRPGSSEVKSGMEVGNTTGERDDKESMSWLSAIESTIRYAGENEAPVVNTANPHDKKNSFYYEMDLFAGFSYNRDFEEVEEGDVFNIMAQREILRSSSPTTHKKNARSL